MEAIGTNIYAQRSQNNGGLLLVTAETTLGTGRSVKATTLLTEAEYESIRRIAKMLSDVTPRLPNNPNFDGSNISTGAQVALIRLHGMGRKIDQFDSGTPAFEVMKRIAFGSQLIPHYELCDRLVAATVEFSENRSL